MQAKGVVCGLIPHIFLLFACTQYEPLCHCAIRPCGAHRHIHRVKMELCTNVIQPAWRKNIVILTDIPIYIIFTDCEWSIRACRRHCNSECCEKPIGDTSQSAIRKKLSINFSLLRICDSWMFFEILIFFWGSPCSMTTIATRHASCSLTRRNQKLSDPSSSYLNDIASI